MTKSEEGSRKADTERTIHVQRIRGRVQRRRNMYGRDLSEEIKVLKTSDIRFCK